MKTKKILLGVTVFLAGAYVQKKCGIIEVLTKKAKDAFEYAKDYIKKSCKNAETESSEEEAQK